MYKDRNTTIIKSSYFESMQKKKIREINLSSNNLVDFTKFSQRWFSEISKAFKMRRFKGCYKWDLTLLNLAPFLFVLITSEPMINIETSISANHNLLLLGKKAPNSKGTSLIYSIP